MNSCTLHRGGMQRCNKCKPPYRGLRLAPAPHPALLEKEPAGLRSVPAAVKRWARPLSPKIANQAEPGADGPRKSPLARTACEAAPRFSAWWSVGDSAPWIRNPTRPCKPVLLKAFGGPVSGLCPSARPSRPRRGVLHSTGAPSKLPLTCPKMRARIAISPEFAMGVTNAW
jgi:hypothetical protein